MKVSTEIDNNFGYEKITQLVDNIPLTTYVHVHYSFLIQQLLYVCYAYLLITKLLKILIFAHGEHKKKLIRMYSILFYIRIHS